MATPKKPMNQRPSPANGGKSKSLGYPENIGKGAGDKGRAGRGIAEDSPGFANYGKNRRAPEKQSRPKAR